MASGSIGPFRPTGTVGVLANGTSASVTLAGGGDSIVVTNTSSSLAYVRFGSDLTVAASSADMPVLPLGHVVLSINSLISTAAAILVAGSGNILFTRGDGSFL